MVEAGPRASALLEYEIYRVKEGVWDAGKDRDMPGGKGKAEATEHRKPARRGFD